MSRSHRSQPGAGAALAPYATAFVSSACVMILELVAGRLVSRHLGNSLYTWTSVIGVILGGLAIGNWLGGMLADRPRPARTLGRLLLAGSAACVAVTVADPTVARWPVLWDLAWPVRVAVHVMLVFLVPSAVLGTIGPVTARLALDTGRSTGRTLGNVYAWGVVGSLVGTFATGYVLIAWLGTAAIVWGVAAVLALAGAAWMPRRMPAWAFGAAVVAALVLSSAPWSWAREAGERLRLREAADPTVVYRDESRYFHIEVREDPLRPGTRGLYLDKLLHSQTSLDEPDRLHYGYARVFAGLAAALAPPSRPIDTLTVGGGGYVVPRWLARRWPGGRHEVVEIDPAVTRAAREAFGLEADTPLRIHHGDGRAFVNRLARERRGGADVEYDLIFIDAVDDFAVPFQLTTAEFFTAAASLLADDGALVVNSIDVVDSGRLVGALERTLADVLPHVGVFAANDPRRMESASRMTLVLAASRRPLPHPARPGEIVAVDDAVVAAWRASSGELVLRDDHAPVEQMMAPVVRASARRLGAEQILRRALTAHQRGDVEAFVAGCRDALAHDEALVEAHYNLGVGLHAQGDVAGAIGHWRRAVELEPGYAAAQFNLGAALFGAGRQGEALPHLRQAVRLEPRLAAGHVGLAVALEAAGDLGGAERHLSEAARLDPSTPGVTARLERVRARRGADAGG